MFIARENELKTLEETYKKPGFQMTVIYGRRRIGKSSLITEFIKNKKSSYYEASQSSLEDNIKKWSGQFIEDILPGAKGAQTSDIETFFKLVGENASDEKLVLALDEIPYIAEADESFLSRFQSAIDGVLSDKNIYLIICGSAISFMEKEVLGEKSPLFGRRTNQLFLKPFDYLDSAKFVPNYSCEEKAIVYGVTGGVAKYLMLFDDKLSLDQNLINNFFRSSGYLFEEPANLLSQEFRNVSSYNTVIEQIAGGATKFSEIADKAQVSTATLNYIIKNLMTVGIVRKVEPLTAERSGKCLYEIADGMYRFWYMFVPRGRSAIGLNRGDVFYENYVKPRLRLFMGSVFEEMARHFTLIQGLDGKLGCLVTTSGRWWGPGEDRRQTDIDVVGVDIAGKKAIIGECKFRNEKMDKPVFESLLSKRGLINKRYEVVQFMLFSLGGFTDWVEKNASADDVRLVSIEDMYK